ncbi:MAG: hypothetical protein Q8N51_01720 [Gammaproteobacteria bacterium]|nr:hypothetical protein [Gammaproteobacteria bacterium]
MSALGADLYSNAQALKTNRDPLATAMTIQAHSASSTTQLNA